MTLVQYAVSFGAKDPHIPAIVGILKLHSEAKRAQAMAELRRNQPTWFKASK
jgi:hypothetical protein